MWKCKSPRPKPCSEASICIFQGLTILMTLGIDWGSLVSTRAAKVPWFVFSMNSVGNQSGSELKIWGEYKCKVATVYFSKAQEGQLGLSQDYRDWAPSFLYQDLDSLWPSVHWHCYWIFLSKSSFRAAGGKETYFTLRIGNCVTDEENSFWDSFKLILQVWNWLTYLLYIFERILSTKTISKNSSKRKKIWRNEPKTQHAN